MNKYTSYLLREIKISKIFFIKLNQNFHTLTLIEKFIYFIFIRFFWKKEKKFFFEASFGLAGQMYVEERKVLYNTIINNKLHQCFEIGTYTGGGSTFFLASAFYKMGYGRLITMESDKRLYNKAKNYYQKKLPHLLPYIIFINSDKVSDFKPFIDEYNGVQSFFLDGAEDAIQSKQQFEYFEKYSNKDTIMVAHDWNTDKQFIVRSAVENKKSWIKKIELKQPDSVGLVVFLKV